MVVSKAYRSSTGAGVSWAKEEGRGGDEACRNRVAVPPPGKSMEVSKR